MSRNTPGAADPFAPNDAALTSLDTLCPGLGRGHDPNAGSELRAASPAIDPLVAPLVLSTTFCRERPADEPQHAYSRVSNPTVSALEDALGRLEDAPPAVAFGSGLAAESALFLSLLRGGDHVVCSRAVYGGTTRLLQQLLSKLGVESDFVDTTDVDAIRAALRPATRLVFVETPANPTLELTDIRAVAEITHAAGALLAVDNTFLTAVLQRPLDLGADLTVTSTTKFVDGHSVALGGSVVSRDVTLLDRLRFVRKCTGGILSPFGAWLTLNGLRTLPLRIRAQSATAERVARWLTAQPAVERVYYPGLGQATTDTGRDAHGSGPPASATRTDDTRLADAHRADGRLAEFQHDGAHGAVVSFEVAGGGEAARKLLAELRLARFVEHVGSVETLITHPASMTHADVPPADREAVGIRDGLLRLSVGLEPAEAITADLRDGLDALSGTSETAEANVESQHDGTHVAVAGDIARGTETVS